MRMFMKLAALLAMAIPAACMAATVHVDCAYTGSADANSAAGSIANPIASLEALNQIRFAPGTRILFKRGSTCYGSFKPAAGSSGKAGAPIVVDAYGDAQAPRPAIAAGCRAARLDPDQAYTASGKTPSGLSPYRSLCSTDDTAIRPAALHLFNVEHWEINALELSNDALVEGARTGLLVQLEDFGSGSHYRVRDVYVHHVRGYTEDTKGRAVAYKETGGILFTITRLSEKQGQKQQKTKFDDVLVEDSEVYHVNGIGLSNRSAWMCRMFGAPCGDYAPYKDNAAYMKEPATRATEDFYPSTNFVLRNNKVHDISGDGIIVRTASAPLIESNLVYDVWMRTSNYSAGVWAINTDDALFRYNEVHGVRIPVVLEPGDGMAFDADLGTRNTRFVSNYSHDNAGGLMLFCGCGEDGFGNPGNAIDAVAENNLSLNDGRRMVLIAGAERGAMRHNIVISNQPGIVTPLVESVRYPNQNEVEMRANIFINTANAGALFRTKNREANYDKLVWSENDFIGYAANTEFQGPRFTRGAKPDRVTAFDGYDVNGLIAKWFTESGFAQNRYKARK